MRNLYQGRAYEEQEEINRRQRYVESVLSRNEHDQEQRRKQEENKRLDDVKKRAFFDAIESRNLAVLSSMLVSDKNLVLQVHPVIGRTPAHIAVERGLADVLDVLIPYCDLAVRTSTGQSLLHLAAHCGHYGVCQKLIGQKVNLNVQDDFGHSALMSAAEAGKSEVVLLLTESHADVSIANKKGKTVFNLLRDSNHSDVAEKVLVIASTLRLNEGGRLIMAKAVKGDASAQCELGEYFCSGKEVTNKDYILARAWCEKSADQGFCKGQFLMGFIFHLGYGVEKDYAVARAYYEKSAAQGFSSAWKNLGLMFEGGLGVDQDFAQARKYFEKSQDCSVSLLHLGILFEEGKGGSVDNARALELYRKADRMGEKDAKERMQKLIEVIKMEFHAAVCRNDVSIVSQMLGKMCFLNCERFGQENGGNFLHAAAHRGLVEMCTYIVEEELVGLGCTDNTGQTAALAAAQNGHGEVVKLLVEADDSLAGKTLNEILRKTGLGDAVNEVICMLFKLEQKRLDRAMLHFPRHVLELLDEYEAIQKTWERLENSLSPLEWVTARNRVDMCWSSLRNDVWAELVEQLHRLEIAVLGSRTLSDHRHAQRQTVYSFIEDERKLVANALQALTAELYCLNKFDVSDGQGGESDVFMESMSIARTLYLKFKGDVVCVKQLSDTLKTKEIELPKCKWNLELDDDDLDALQDDIVKCQKELMALHKSVYERVREVRGSIKKAGSGVCAHFQCRRAHVVKIQRELFLYADSLNSKSVELKRALAAFPLVRAVQAKVEEALESLERSKIFVQLAEMNLKVGRGSQQDVIYAMQIVEEHRASYAIAVRHVVQVRNAGYPELHCVAAVKHEKLPNVPLISFKDLEQRQKIGAGAFAAVFEVELPVTGKCAFKQFFTDINHTLLSREASAMWELRHSERVVRLLKLCVDEGHQGLLLELMEGGSLGALLHERKERLGEKQMLQVMHDVAAGLVCVHECNQVHLDIKADNILLTKEGRAKLGDFGASKEFRKTCRDTELALTFRWSAPELFKSPPKISRACDIWSFGMVMFEMIMGEVPYAGAEVHTLAGKILKEALPYDPKGEGGAESKKLDPRLVRIMQMCWQVDPEKRPSAARLLEEIASLLVQECCLCLAAVQLTAGVYCSEERNFLCHECIPDMAEGQLSSGLNLRPDGAIVTKDGGVFELQIITPHLGKDLFGKWQAAQLKAKEVEVALHYHKEMEEAKAMWERQDHADRLAREIERDVLTISCPKCKVAFQYEGGCMALYHSEQNGGCGCRFCGFCFNFSFVDGANSHAHAASCEYNPRRGDYDPPRGDELAFFAEVQRQRQIRELRRRFAQMEENVRAEVCERLANALSNLRIQKNEFS